MMPRLALLVLLLTLVAGFACSSSKRSSDENLPSDAGQDTDTNSSWDGGNDDFEVLEPTALWGGDHHCEPFLGFDGSNLAVAWSDDKVVQNESTRYTVLFVFPWSLPDLASYGYFEQGPPACDEGYGWNGPVSKPYPVDGGFFLLTATNDDNQCEDTCQAVTSTWNLDGQVSEGPHGLYDIYQCAHSLHVFDSFGWQKPDGTVLIGDLECPDCNQDEVLEKTLFFQVDRFGPDAFHENLMTETFPWTEQYAETGRVVSGYGGQNTFVWGDQLATVGAAIDGIVLATATVDGELLSEPAVVIYNPFLDEDPPRRVRRRSYTQSSDSLLVVIQYGFELSEDEPTCQDELYSYILEPDGDVLSGPTFLVSYPSTPTQEEIMSTWSGSIYGVCYREPFDTFKFMALDKDGQLLKDPVPIFWDMPPPIDGTGLACDIVAIDEDTFAVAMRVDTHDQADYPDGLYITYVTTLFVE